MKSPHLMHDICACELKTFSCHSSTAVFAKCNPLLKYYSLQTVDTSSGQWHLKDTVSTGMWDWRMSEGLRASSGSYEMEKPWSPFLIEDWKICLIVKWFVFSVESDPKVLIETSLFSNANLHLIHPKYSKNSNIVIYYYNLNNCSLFEYILKCNVFLWCKPEFLADITPVLNI